MKDIILQKATHLFLTLGFKSVTMDDIAANMGISKKTIYQSFSNKDCLVKECVLCLFNFVSSGIDDIRKEQKNPIEELFEIKNFIAIHVKDESSSPMYQLQKYFPSIHKLMRQKHLTKIEECIVDNLNRGVAQNMFRPDINISFIARIYFTGVTGIKDPEVFPLNQYDSNEVIEQFLDYHIRAIATPEGIEIMKQIQIK